MGNRVVIQFVSGKEVSPAIYGHWHGSEAAATLVALREQMSDRPGDVTYVTARCIGRMIGADDGSTGFGVWNAPRPLTAKDSHGDAGVYLVDISDPQWRVTMIDGRVNERGTVRSTKDVVFTEYVPAKRNERGGEVIA